MRGLVVTFLVWVLCAMLGAYDIRSITAVDLTKTSNRVEIELSGPAKYTVQPLSNGEGVRLVFSNAGSVKSAPVYQRLSETIYSITTQSDGQKTFVDIQTMGKVEYSHSTNTDKDRITLSLRKAGTEQPKQDAKPKLKQPVKAPQTPAQPTLPSAVKTLPAPAESTRAIPQKVTPHIAENDSSDRAQNEAPPVSRARMQPLFLIAGFGILALFLFIVFWKYFRRIPVKTARHKAEKPFEGPTLMLDSETRSRMVKKLTEQGWTAREIARELKISPKDVEGIIATAKSSGNER